MAEHRTRKNEHGADRDYAISVGLRMLTLRHLVIEADDTYRANPKELVLLQYYANGSCICSRTGVTIATVRRVGKGA